ncbi:MAG: hypothetical protein LBC64_09125, partial [Fibromonadaceae bacterium]|nr:hypothetical protein [Fibromonadaceae bacterium]
YAHYLWFNNFEGRCKEGDADFYIFFGLYSQYSPRKNIDSGHYEPVFLCFKEREMLRFLAGARTKKGKRDSFFSFGFDSPEIIYETRREEKPNVSEFLLERQINKIIAFF